MTASVCWAAKPLSNAVDINEFDGEIERTNVHGPLLWQTGDRMRRWQKYKYSLS
jgi:hypothetical protein